VKIVSWNCNGAFRKKYQFISQDDIDIYIIQECEDPKQIITKDPAYEYFTQHHLWIGNNKNKGLGVFIKNGINYNKIEFGNKFNGLSLKWFIPFEVNNQQIIAVWSHHGDSDEYRYIGQLWCYLQVNKQLFNKPIILGDFNSNAIWDYKRSECTHTNCVKQLKDIGIQSVYHTLENVDHGKELLPTFYLQKKLNKKYHIDYIFSPKELLEKTKQFSIANFENWKEISDHVPVLWEY
jgi:exonuclease III